MVVVVAVASAPERVGPLGSSLRCSVTVAVGVDLVAADLAVEEVVVSVVLEAVVAVAAEPEVDGNVR